MSDSVVHFEVPADDVERARAFYANVFGWTILPMPAMDYTLVTTGPTPDGGGPPSEPGFINGGMFQRSETLPSPVIVLAVDNIAQSLEAVTANGGQAVGETQNVGDMGFAAYFKDSEGNVMGLWQNA